MDARPPVASFFDAFGVPATVTPPDQAAVETTVVWISPFQDVEPPGGQFGKREPRRILALRLDEVEAVPRGTKVVAPMVAGRTAEVWIVDGPVQVEDDHYRVFVVRG